MHGIQLLLPLACLLSVLGAPPSPAEELGAKSQRGKELMAAGRYAEAVPVYRDLVTAVPGNPGLLLNLGMALHLSGEDEEAIPRFEAALLLQPDSLPAALFLGASRLRLGRTTAAIAPLQKAVRLAPANRDARSMLAEALVASERYADAEPHLRRLARSAPSDPAAWFNLGKAYEELAAQARAARRGRYPESPLGPARAAEEPAKPDCARAPLQCLFLEGKYHEVVAAAARGRGPEALHWRARAYGALAAQAFDRLAALPPSALFHERMAEVRRDERRYPESAAHWRKAIALAPEDPQLRLELAVTLRLGRDFAGAREVLESLHGAAPDAPDLNYFLGDVLLAQDDPAGALPFLEKAVRLEPGAPHAHGALGRAYALVGRAADAVVHLQQALPADVDGSLRYQLARSYQAAGRPEEARIALRDYEAFRKSHPGPEAGEDARTPPP